MTAAINGAEAEPVGRRRLRSGLEISELALGLSQLGNLFRETTDSEAIGALEAAWAGGIRMFDTAPHYGLGLSEQRVGAYLRHRPRSDFVLSTKVGRLLVDNPRGAETTDPEGFAVPARTRRVWDFTREGVLRSIDESLTRMGIDRIDIAYLHDPDDFGEVALREAIPTLEDLRSQGVIRAIGVGMNQAELPAHFIRNSDLDLVMLAGRYTLLEQGALVDLLPLALERGIGIVVAGVYNSGILSTHSPADDATYDYGAAPRPLIDTARRIALVCEEYGVTLPEAAMAFPLLHPAVVSIVVGARNDNQVESNLARYKTAIPDQLWPALAEQNLIPAASFAPHQENR